MKTALIIPTFNRNQLLLRAIKSGLNQTRPFNEIIVVNDGDDIHVPKADTVRLFSTTKKEGPTRARILAINSTSCDTICYLDDDDELLPNHLEKLIPEIEKGHEFSFTKALYKYPDFETEDPEPNNKGNKRYYDKTALLDQNIAPISSFIHTKKAYDKIGGWDSSLLRMEDWDFWGRMFIEFGPPSFVNDVTNIIYKGIDNNRTDSNQFVYAMGCHWRDVVSDRLKYLSSKQRGKIIKEDAPFIQRVPKIGVVIPVYNSERHLEQSIDSILSQTFKDFEIIAIDDGSTDKSSAILNNYSVSDRRVRVFRNQENLGVSRSLNLGVVLSRSEYIARMDSDDISHPERFSLQVEFLEKNKDIYIVGSCFDSVSEDLKNLIWRNDVEKTPEDIRRTLLDRCCIGHPTVMMRRRLFEILGGYSEKQEHYTIEDYELWLRASKRFDIANLSQFLLTHRVYNNQISSRLSEIQKLNTEKLKMIYKIS